MENLIDFKPLKANESVNHLSTAVTFNPFDESKNKYLVYHQNVEGEVISNNPHEGYKTALNEFLSRINEVKDGNNIILSSTNSTSGGLGDTLLSAKNGYNNLDRILNINQDKPKLVVEITEAAPEFIKDELASNHGFEHGVSKFGTKDYRINNSQLSNDLISPNHISNAPKETYVIAGLKYAGMHYEGYNISKEIVTNDPDEAIAKLVRLNEDKVTYNLYRCTTDKLEFKIDSFGDPVNAMTEIVARKNTSRSTEIYAAKTIEIIAKDPYLIPKKFVHEAIVNEFEIRYGQALDNIERHFKANAHSTPENLSKVFKDHGFEIYTENSKNKISFKNIKMSVEEVIGKIQEYTENYGELERKKKELSTEKAKLIKNEPGPIKSFFFPTSQNVYNSSVSQNQLRESELGKKFTKLEESPIFNKDQLKLKSLEIGDATSHKPVSINHQNKNQIKSGISI